MADGGPLQMSLFDEQDLAEITSPDFPGERLVACRNPVLAADRARTRDELLAATEKLLAPILARVQGGKLACAGPIGVEVGKVISRYKTGKHFAVTITDTSLAVAEATRSTPRPPWTGSTCSAPRSPPPSSTRPPCSPPTSRQVRRAGLPAHQIRRPGPAAGLPPARGTRQGARTDLHARLTSPGTCAAPGPR